MITSDIDMKSGWFRQRLAGYDIYSPAPENVVDFIEAHMSRVVDSGLLSIFFANANSVVKCTSIRKNLSGDRVLLLNDGVALNIACRLLGKAAFPHNLNGTDFLPFFFLRARKSYRIFLLGAEPGIAEQAGNKIAAESRHQVVGWCDGFAGMDDADALIKHINGLEVDVLLVAMGNPRQEQWILQNKPHLQVKVAFAVGALFDFMAGKVSRAPIWVRKLRCEWLYRLCQEPKRLVRRYTLETLVFIYKCCRDRYL